MLQKEPRGRDVNDGDKFLFNQDFTAKLHRIKVNSIQLKETAEENEKTHETVFRDRKYQVRTGGDRVGWDGRVGRGRVFSDMSWLFGLWQGRMLGTIRTDRAFLFSFQCFKKRTRPIVPSGRLRGLEGCVGELPFERCTCVTDSAL